jgi:putative membrane protein
MDRQPEIRQRAALSDYLAAERTLLAWIRTGLALMGFGFVVRVSGSFYKSSRLPNTLSRHGHTGYRCGLVRR